VSAPVLELRGIKAGYGKIQVLHGLDLVIPPSSVVALLGRNGAGKTTTLKVASGQIRPSAGVVEVAGKPVTGCAPDALARAGVCTIPEGRGVFPNLTVTENLKMVTFAGVSQHDVLEQAFERFPRLKERADQLAGTMSGGEQQMLAMARAVATDPALLLLDELSMGLAPLVVEGLYELVKQIAAEGVSILVVEQFARTALAVADYAALMVQGRITSVGQPADLEEELEATYLGGAA
jgi:branched-chain amino acid transport system ATP-binding protein